jgi:hypothetical protein
MDTTHGAWSIPPTWEPYSRSAIAPPAADTGRLCAVASSCPPSDTAPWVNVVGCLQLAKSGTKVTEPLWALLFTMDGIGGAWHVWLGSPDTAGESGGSWDSATGWQVAALLLATLGAMIPDPFTSAVASEPAGSTHAP